MKRLLLFLLTAIFVLSSVAYASSNVRVYVNGMRVNEDVVLKNNTTYIPLRAVSEALGADVEWDGASRSAFITFTEEDAISKVVTDVSPSVVTIIGNYAGTGATNQYNNPTAHGSGVIYKSNGYIITNAHVVKDIKNLTVVLNDGQTFPGQVLFSDEKADLAIVKIDKIGLKAVSMADMSTVLSGKTAIAIGTPISLSMRNTVTRGIVCGTGVSMSDSYYKLIQTDATINPGNSGGPLLNSRGELIGINSSKYASLSIDNMAFAIPVDTVQYAINQYEKNGYIKRPTLDMELDASWEAKIGLPTTKGLTVRKSNCPNIVAGDIVVSINDIAVHSMADLNEAIKNSYDGLQLKIGYTRSGVIYYTTIQG